MDSAQGDVVGQEQAELPTSKITFRDRVIEVRAPSPQRLVVWRRTLRWLQAADPESWTGDDVLDALERGRKIVDSMFVQPADVRWLDDETLDHDLSIGDITTIINDSVASFGHRAERRVESEKVTPKKKAARKKV